MWHTILMFTFLSMLLCFLKKISINEPNAVKYHFMFSIYYIVTSVVAAVIWPFFLLRPRNVRNAKFAVIVYTKFASHLRSSGGNFLTIKGVTMWHIVLMFTFLSMLLCFLKKISINEPNAVKYHFMFSIYYIVTSVVAAVIWPFFLLRPRNVRNANFPASFISYVVNKIYDIKWILRNEEILAEDRGAVVVANHQLSLDILGMFTVWNTVGKVAAIAKKQLFYVFPFGLCAYLAGVVFIDRNNPMTAYKQLEETSEVMVKNKAKIWLFPEGTRNKDYTKLLPFKKGAFKIAVAAQVPIIPIVYSPYYFINAARHIFSKGHIIIQVLEPIPTVGMTDKDIPALIEKVHQRMSATYKELSKEVLNDLPANYPYTNIG